jgi:hypothetical protein
MAFLTMRLARSASSTPMADLLSQLKARHVRKWHTFPVRSAAQVWQLLEADLPCVRRPQIGRF